MDLSSLFSINLSLGPGPGDRFGVETYQWALAPAIGFGGKMGEKEKKIKENLFICSNCTNFAGDLEMIANEESI